MKVDSGARGERQCTVLPNRLLANARILPKRADLLPLLPTGGVFVEIGVALGDYSAKIMKVCRPDLFIGIDIFTIHEAAMIWGRPTIEVFSGKTHEAFYRDRFQRAIATGRMRVIAGDSSTTLAQFDDASIDVAYVDADHTYTFVRNELALLNCKVNETGWIVLNDYTMGNVAGGKFTDYGVIQATHDFMIEHNWEMMYLALHPKTHYDVALRRSR
jgi:hypothetical protein